MARNQEGFTIARKLDIPKEKLWLVWTDEDYLAQWLPGTSRELVNFDVREGGRYQYTMVNTETQQMIHTGGIFLEIIPQSKLVMTWGKPEDQPEDSPLIKLNFNEEEGGTTMVFQLEGMAGAPGDHFVYDGWVASLDQLIQVAAGIQ